MLLISKVIEALFAISLRVLSRTVNRFVRCCILLCYNRTVASPHPIVSSLVPALCDTEMCPEVFGLADCESETESIKPQSSCVFSAHRKQRVLVSTSKGVEQRSKPKMSAGAWQGRQTWGASSSILLWMNRRGRTRSGEKLEANERTTSALEEVNAFLR